MANIILQKKGVPSWITYIHNRIENKKNFLGFISGATGSGKSWAGLSICYMLDKDFKPNRIVTNMRQLIKLINSENLKSGSAILWDEAGIDISSKNWQSLTNKLINFLMQTFRHRRFCLIFTSPYLDYIDASTRKLFHAEFQMQKINYADKKSIIKPFLIQYNSRNRKFYYKYLRVRTSNKRTIKIGRWGISKPPEWLIEQYEEIKTKFTTDLNKDIERQLDKLEEKKTTGKKPLTEIQENVLRLMAQYDDVERVAKELGVTERTVYFHISQAKKKKYKIEEFIEPNNRKIDKLA